MRKRVYLEMDIIHKAYKILNIELKRNQKDHTINEIILLGLDAYIEKKGYNLNPSEEELKRFENLKRSLKK